MNLEGKVNEGDTYMTLTPLNKIKPLHFHQGEQKKHCFKAGVDFEHGNGGYHY